MRCMTRKRDPKRLLLQVCLAVLLVSVDVVSTSLRGQSEKPSKISPPLKIEWRIGTDLPMNWKGGAAGALEGRVVYAGGLQSPWRAPKEAVLFDPEADHHVYCWLPELPVAPQYTGGLSVGNAFYVLGGRSQAARRRVFRLTRKDKDALTVSTGPRCAGEWVWEEAASMHQDHLLPDCAAVGDTIVVTGGISGVGDGMEAYNTKQPEAGWFELPPAPVMRASAAAASGGKLYLFGGLAGDDAATQTSARAFSLDLAARSWKEIKSMPLPLRFAKAVSYQDRYIIILGGGSRSDPGFPPMKIPGGPIGQLSPFVIVYDTNLDEYWQLKETMPVGVATQGSVLIGDTIYVIGGETRDPPTSNCSNKLQIGKIVSVNKSNQGGK